MSNLEKQSYEVYFDGDLSRYYEYAFLNKVNDGWKLEISYCTPEKSGRKEMALCNKFRSVEEVEIYIGKVKKVFSKYRGKSICYFIDEIFSCVNALGI